MRLTTSAHQNLMTTESNKQKLEAILQNYDYEIEALEHLSEEATICSTLLGVSASDEKLIRENMALVTSTIDELMMRLDQSKEALRRRIDGDKVDYGL